MAAGDVVYSAYPEGTLPAFACGSLTCDASDPINVLCGFQPSRIELHYKDSGAVLKDVVILWYYGMTAANYWNTLMSSGVITLVTSGGPVVYAGTSNYTEGFTVPAALMDNDADSIYWTAWR